MIHSAIEDNWMRVKIMHSAAYAVYLETCRSDYRERKLNGGDIFPFNAVEYETIKKESSMVGMVMAWSVVFLECIVNHALAEKLSDDSIIIDAIESPKRKTKNCKALKNIHVGLVHKLAILSNNLEVNQNIVDVVCELSSIRNRVVHDKPFELVDHGEGRVEITNFLKRGDGEFKRYVYDDLKHFFKKCDEIKRYITNQVAVYDTCVDIENISFSQLIHPCG